MNNDLENIELVILPAASVSGSDQLDVFGWPKIGSSCEMTDFTRLMGGHGTVGVKGSNEYAQCYTSSYSKHGLGDLEVINSDGSIGRDTATTRRENCIRPAFKVSEDFFNEYRQHMKISDKAPIQTLEFGMYPQTVASTDMQEKLEASYNENALAVDGSFTFDGSPLYGFKEGIKPVTYDEYIFEGKRYIRLVPKAENGVQVSNGNFYNKFHPVWVEVEPILWYYDEKSSMMVSEKALIAGVRYNDKEFKHVRFNKSEVYEFLNEYMKKDIAMSDEITLSEDNVDPYINYEESMRLIEKAIAEENQRYQEKILETKDIRGLSEEHKGNIRELEESMRVLEELMKYVNSDTNEDDIKRGL